MYNNTVCEIQLSKQEVSLLDNKYIETMDTEKDIKEEIKILSIPMLHNFVEFTRTSSLSKLKVKNGSSPISSLVSSKGSFQMSDQISKLTQLTKSTPGLNIATKALHPAKSSSNLRSTIRVTKSDTPEPCFGSQTEADSKINRKYYKANQMLRR